MKEGRHVAKVIMICGKICSGKSTYAEKLRDENKAVMLSVDDIMLAVFGQHAGSRHDEYTGKIQEYLFAKSLEIIHAGCSVILDWGFWTKKARSFAREFYAKHDIPCEMHYINACDETLRKRVLQRNREVTDGAKNAYFVDENIAAKCDTLFEAPDKSETDIIINV